MGNIVIFCQCVSFPGRYGHEKTAKPVNVICSSYDSFLNISIVYHMGSISNRGTVWCPQIGIRVFSSVHKMGLGSKFMSISMGTL